MPEFLLRPIESTDADLARLQACFERSGSPRTVEHLRWQYLSNPMGRVYIDAAVAENQPDCLAAVYATAPVFLRIGDRVVPGVQSLDTLTDAELRNQGLFIRLAKGVFERCTRDGMALAYGFPSASSAPELVEQLEWLPLAPEPFLIRPLRLNYALRRLPRIGEQLARLPALPLLPPFMPRLARGVSVRPVLAFDRRFDELWDRFARSVEIAVQRDSRYLQWRIKDKPGVQYRVLGMYEGEHLVAWTAYDLKEKHGSRIGYVLELLHEPGRERDASTLLQVALHEMHSSDAEIVLAWCLEHSPNRAGYRRQGFFALPERLRTAQPHLGVRHLAERRAESADRRNWYVSYLDSDAV